MWLVPRPVEHSGILVLSVDTAFGKSNEAPPAISASMDLPSLQTPVPAVVDETLGAFIDALLARGPRWPLGSPIQQERRREDEVERAVRHRVAMVRHLEECECRVKKVNRHSASRAATFGTHRGVFGGAVRLGFLPRMLEMLVPIDGMGRLETSLRQSGDVDASLAGKSEVGIERFENHPTVHKAVDEWTVEVQSDIEKTEIERTATANRRATPTACSFVLPSWGCPAWPPSLANGGR